jgi:hypothetical protein
VYLVDANIISAGASSRIGASAALIAWMDHHSADLYMSAVSVADIGAGIARFEERFGTPRPRSSIAW